MVRDDGSLDIEKTQKFMDEFRLRFGVDAIGKYSNYNDPDNPLERDRNVLKKSANQWLMRELNIPSENKADFERFIDASFVDSNFHRKIGSMNAKPFRIDSMFEVVDKWIQNCRNYDNYIGPLQYDNRFAFVIV